MSRGLLSVTVVLSLLFALGGCGDDDTTTGGSQYRPVQPPADTGTMDPSPDVESPTPLPPAISNGGPVLVPPPRTGGTGDYSVVDGFAGTSVQGRVIWKGTPPESPQLACHKDQATCCSGEEKTRPSFRILVSKENQGVQNCVVYLTEVAEGKPFGKQGSLDQKECVYVPHVLLVQADREFVLASSDPILHTINIYRGDTQIKNIPFPVPDRQKFELEPGFYNLSCEAGHTWMNGWIVATEHPYYAVTAENGSFNLDNVPDGIYDLVVWHEGWELLETRRDAQGNVTGYIFSKPVTKSFEVQVDGGNVTGLPAEIQLN